MAGTGILGNPGGLLGRFMLGRIPTENPTGATPCPYIPARTTQPNPTFTPRMANDAFTSPARPPVGTQAAPNLPVDSALDTTTPRPSPTADTIPPRKKECR